MHPYTWDVYIPHCEYSCSLMHMSIEKWYLATLLLIIPYFFFLFISVTSSLSLSLLSCVLLPVVHFATSGVVRSVVALPPFVVVLRRLRLHCHLLPSIVALPSFVVVNCCMPRFTNVALCCRRMLPPTFACVVCVLCYRCTLHTLGGPLRCVHLGSFGVLVVC